MPQRIRCCVFAGFAALGGTGLAGDTEELAFETDIRPILKAACFHCHGEDDVKKGELDVRLVRLMIEGGKSGAALIPGDLAGSPLWEKIASDEMPKGEKKLAAEQKRLIRGWITAGARTLRPEPENVEDAKFTLEELGHWAFQPVAKVEPPSGEENPIDAFVAAKLAEEGLSFSEPADRRSLIRRLSFDITGLPPTPEEVEAFVNDTEHGADGRLVDRLLGSLQYGVRWAQHWLDAAGYAESEGNALGDPKRPHAWRFRDYVIESFNTNKPIDQFFIEQLAGDELIGSQPDPENERHAELLAATGFLRTAPDATQQSNSVTDRNAAVADTLQIVSTSMLGLTVGCAQCHDHKYDPIGIDDYYRFRAIFDPAFPLEKWRQPSNRLVDLTPAEVRAERERIEAEAKKIEDDVQARRMAHCAEIQEKKLTDVPEDKREAVREAVLAAAGKRTEEQKQLLEQFPMVKPVGFISGLLVEYDGAAHRRFEEEKKKAAEVRAKMPPARLVRSVVETPGFVPVSRVFFRGNPESPRDEVKAAELTVLRQGRGELPLPDNDPSRPTTGRRLAYARQLANAEHPLVARVFVNRVWMHHFGRGLVATPGDFGIAGEEPSHPELLDWLATEFVASGWDLKRLHRIIVTSKTYQQRSARRPELDAIDPENTLLGRTNLRRLDAEAIRDAILAANGKLDTKLGGPSSPVTENNEGKAVIGTERNRRGAYVETQRRLPLNMLATFDQPVMTPNCDRRRMTTVATQALWFLNDSEIVRHSEDLARSLIGHAETEDTQLTELYLRLFANPPGPDELATCRNYLAEQGEQFAKADPKADARHRALASLCQVLFASNRFLYID